MFPGFFTPTQLTPNSKVQPLVNCTPHPIRFLDNSGQVVEVKPSGYTLKATPLTTFVKKENGIEFVKTSFVANEESTRDVESLEKRGWLPVGSIISAQAWPGRVASLIPVEGFERKPPAEKLYRVDKFNIF